MGYNFTRFAAPVFCQIAIDFRSRNMACMRFSRFLLMLLISLACGCATIGPGGGPGPMPYGTPTPSQPQGNPNPPSSVNLQGFPLEYRQGYADGCASISGSERKDAMRFKNDGQYRTGWQDGNALCRKR